MLNYILSKRMVSVDELSETFRVSPMTIRRDLNQFEKEGLVKRVSGGAVITDDRHKEPSYKVRAFSNPKQKEKIASLVEEIIEDDELIFLDIGSTCLQCAKRIVKKNITVVTNWIPNILELTKYSECEIINTGGIICKEELSSVGVSAFNAVGNFTFSKAILGIGGITEDGISDYRIGSVEIKRRVIERAKEVIVLADHSKFGKKAPIHIASLEKVDKIIAADIDKIPEWLLQLQQIKNLLYKD